MLTISGTSPSCSERSRNIVGSIISSDSSIHFIWKSSSVSSMGSSLIGTTGSGCKRNTHAIRC